MSVSRRSRVFTISFPEDLARQVDQLARRESRNISELFREAFRIYRLEAAHRHIERARAAASLRIPQEDYKQADIERLVDEVRSSRVRKKKK
jgi:metal-responsive CopG/Arc/MetJ family transcriptional regulator